jgi:hypothetical protein
MYMYFDMYPKESQIHLGYMSDASRYMYLARFLGVTLDTYQDTSGYVYPGLFITIHVHQDTPRYKITLHIWILDGIHVGYNPKCIPRMYPEKHVSEIQARYIQDTFGINVSAEVNQIHTGYI